MDMQFYIEIITLIIFLIMSVQDIREKKVSLWIVIVALALGVTYFLIELIHGSKSSYELIAGLIPAALMTIMKIIAGDHIGIADCILLIIPGILLGINELIVCVAVTFGVMTFVSFLMLTTKKATKKTLLPMIPFISVGLMAGMFYGNIS